MVLVVKHLTSPVALPTLNPPSAHALSVVTYSILLPNSVDGWWNYKMYYPPLEDDDMGSWNYRKNLLKDRLSVLDADVVCLQECAPESFDDDFQFMQDLGYDGVELFKKGRFRPATFWRTSQLELTSSPVHKDRTLLTCFRRKVPTTDYSDENDNALNKNWYVLNCHLQAGNQAQRRVRQINEGIRAVLTLARKQEEQDPEKSIRLVVCGDFNGGKECAAVRYLEDGRLDETFLEDGNTVTSSTKTLPLYSPLQDVATLLERDPPATLVVPELISQMIDDTNTAYEDPQMSQALMQRLTTIYQRFATHDVGDGTKQMNVDDVEKWLIAINKEPGRGDEFREAGRQMRWTDPDPERSHAEQKARITLPRNELLTLEGFLAVYQQELNRGKFWGIAHDIAVLGEPLPDIGVFRARYDRIYCSASIWPVAVVDTCCDVPCPNPTEPSDHLPVAAVFTDR